MPKLSWFSRKLLGEEAVERTLEVVSNMDYFRGNFTM